jgi:1,4-alpha-glucan branching enzyme
LFNYGHWEVLRFLLSNLRYWVDEFGFDGFRFDGVTSMIYKHHGIGSTPMSYNEHFGGEVDDEALLYLGLANDMLRQVDPDIVTISEGSFRPSKATFRPGLIILTFWLLDVSGFATMCRPIAEGGVGFNYRLGMGIPDKWIECMKISDDDWNVGNIAFTLSNRRWKEATVWIPLD